MNLRSMMKVFGAIGLSIVLACCGSPEGKKKAVRKTGGDTSAKTVQELKQCRQKLSKPQKLGKEMTNQICVKDSPEQIARFSTGEQKEIANSPSPLGKGYVVKEIPILATISQSQDKEKWTSVKVRAEIRYEDEFAERAAESLRDGNSIVLNIKNCVTKINTVLQKSHIKFTLDLRDDPGSEGDSETQVIDIVSLPQGSLNQNQSTSNPRFGLKYWPDHSALYPTAASMCRSSAKCRNQDDREKCVAKCIRDRKEPFCQSFAKLVAHWMNVQDPAVADQCREPVDVNPLAKGNSLALGYLKPDSKSVYTESEDIETDVGSDENSAAASANDFSGDGLVAASNDMLTETLTERRALDKKSGKNSTDPEVRQKDDGDPMTYAKQCRKNSTPTTAETFWTATCVNDESLKDILDPVCSFDQAEASANDADKKADKKADGKKKRKPRNKAKGEAFS